MSIVQYFEKNEDGSRTSIIGNADIFLQNLTKDGMSKKDAIDFILKLEGKTVTLKDNKIIKVEDI